VVHTWKKFAEIGFETRQRPICLGEVLISQSSGQDELPGLVALMGRLAQPPLTRAENIELAKRSMRALFRY
jgi:hypothetical protein